MENDRLTPSEAHGIILYHLEQMMPALRLASSDLLRLVEIVQVRGYVAGETILPARGEVEFLGLVIAGQVAVLNGHGALARRTAILLPGHTFGQMSSPAYPAGATLQAITPCQIWFLRCADLSFLVSNQGVEQASFVNKSPVSEAGVTTPPRTWSGERSAAYDAVLIPPSRPSIVEGSGIYKAVVTVPPGAAFVGKSAVRRDVATVSLRAESAILESRVGAPLRPSAMELGQALDAWPLASGGRAGRRTLNWSQVRWAALALGLVLSCIVFVLHGVPVARQVLALGAMGFGQLCKDSDYERCAGTAWRLATALTPTDANPLLALGTLYAEEGDLDSAQRAFEDARSLAPDAPEAENNLGFIYAQAGDQTQAVAAFRRALNRQRGVAAVEHNLAFSLHALGAYDEALDHYRAALALGGSPAEILASEATACYQMGQSAESVEVARQALDYDPSLSQAHTVLGAVALDSLEMEDVLPHLNRAIVLDPANAQAHTYLGLFYELVDQPAMAMTAFTRALSNVKDDSMRAQLQLHLDRATAREAVLHNAADVGDQNR